MIIIFFFKVFFFMNMTCTVLHLATHEIYISTSIDTFHIIFLPKI